MEERVALIMGKASQQPFSVAPQSEDSEFSNAAVNQRPIEQRDRQIRVVLSLMLVTFLIFVIVDSYTNKYIEGLMVTFVTWVQEHPGLGVLAVIVMYILATVLFVPGAVLTLGTGFAFGSAFDSTAKGVAVASMAVFIGAFLGSISSFLLGRYLFRDCVLRMASKYKLFRAIDKALEGNGLKIMILLRLSPLVPYNALDYLSGLTSISLWAYSVALIAILPGILVFCFLGATASSITSGGAENAVVKNVTLVLGVIFAFIGVAAASYYSKLELNKILVDEEQNDQSLMDELAQKRQASPNGEVSQGNFV